MLILSHLQGHEFSGIYISSLWRSGQEAFSVSSSSTIESVALGPNFIPFSTLRNSDSDQSLVSLSSICCLYSLIIGKVDHRSSAKERLELLKLISLSTESKISNDWENNARLKRFESQIFETSTYLQTNIVQSNNKNEIHHYELCVIIFIKIKSF